MDKLDHFLTRAEALIARLETLLPDPAPAEPDWSSAIAFRWLRRNGRGALYPVNYPHTIRLTDLQNIDEQKQRIDQNTRQFVAGRPANNVLLTGARGAGKSSLVKAVLNEYAAQGLRVIEVSKDGLADLPDIVTLIAHRPERFILYCDDLSFDAEDSGYAALKAILDGSLATLSDNLLIYATSNRRHLMPEYMAENLATRYVGEEIHPAESVEEKISLSERFGLWISFYPFSQDQYLNIVSHWLRHFGYTGELDEATRQDALQWALGRGARNGRVAWQFAKDWAGRQSPITNRPTSKT
ncbi:MAG: ATP-binding protein [Gallionellaceae bacterium]|jgi:predicted AAA+ superfamily ATPase|nr:ATP-binding protein [Gallionellaceae bacterium]